ncbi:Protein CBG26911 [Caenorhabditis briggsae]|uniref:Protein CBG26911 n=1 Tax=Caenorhabditis briggsae TaxID=6238 RepID=B6IEQ4_CAEBR|nr:Protein CBG26911 [Caenorhabditis briggsae]CAR98384.1 Protein CBG26911 [Caenorhabditis briggsae]
MRPLGAPAVFVDNILVRRSVEEKKKSFCVCDSEWRSSVSTLIGWGVSRRREEERGLHSDSTTAQRTTNNTVVWKVHTSSRRLGPGAVLTLLIVGLCVL